MSSQLIGFDLFRSRNNFFSRPKKTQITLLANDDDPITKQMVATDYYDERFSLELFVRLAGSNFVRDVVDVGAYIGLYSLAVARYADKCRIVSFEPSAANYFRFLTHIQMNSAWFKISPIQMGLSDKKEFLDLYHPFDRYVLSSGESIDFHKDSYVFKESIPVHSFDDILNNLNEAFPPEFKVDLIKIDVEGHELRVLKGMAKTIESRQPVVFVEILEDSSIELVLDLLTGYSIARIADQENRIVHPYLPIKSPSRNFLLVPSNKLTLVSELINQSENSFYCKLRS